jgi:hypothetical protein
MTARCIPAEPTFASRAERTVWSRLKSQLPDGSVLLANVRFTGYDGDWEVDLIVGLPGSGFAAIEVKGGQVWRADGQWWQRTAQGDKVIDLDEQSKSEKYLVGRFLERNPRWSGGRPRMVHMAALPDTRVGPEDPSPGLPRAWIVDKGDLPDAAGRIYDLLQSDLANQPHRRPGPDEVDLAAELIGGRGDPQADVARLQEVREEHCDRLTTDQFRVLDMARRIPRYEVAGGPGTGKTWLAIEQARRWAEEGQRVAFVCYSRGLATWVSRRVESWRKPLRRNVKVRTFHGLGVDWGVRIADGRGADYWEDELPADMLDLARHLDDAGRFDALVVDEAQDFLPSWWEPLLAALRDPAAARIAVFTDEQQRIFDREGGADLGLVPLDLTENLRNTRQIGAVFVPLAAPAPKLLGGEGPPVRFVATTDETAMDAADDAALGLLDAGWAPRDVAILSTHHRHHEQVSRVEHFGRDGYWDSFWDDGDMFWSTVAGFKGLERPAVVLAVDGFRDPATARETLYVGLSRARDLLVVVADPETLRAVGGDEVAKRVLGEG